MAGDGPAGWMIRMSSALGVALPLGLAAAVSPVMLAEQALLVAGPGGRRAGAWYATGTALVIAAVCALVEVFGRSVALPRAPHLDAGLDLLLGATLLLLAVVVARGGRSVRRSAQATGGARPGLLRSVWFRGVLHGHGPDDACNRARGSQGHQRRGFTGHRAAGRRPHPHRPRDLPGVGPACGRGRPRGCRAGGAHRGGPIHGSARSHRLCRDPDRGWFAARRAGPAAVRWCARLTCTVRSGRGGRPRAAQLRGGYRQAACVSRLGAQVAARRRRAHSYPKLPMRTTSRVIQVEAGPVRTACTSSTTKSTALATIAAHQDASPRPRAVAQPQVAEAHGAVHHQEGEAGHLTDRVQREEHDQGDDARRSQEQGDVADSPCSAWSAAGRSPGAQPRRSRCWPRRRAWHSRRRRWPTGRPRR